MPAVSVIVRTFNEQKHLHALFDAFERQTFRDFETIVVDSGSFDQTREIAEQRADKLIRISSHDFTFGYSLNIGIKAAAGHTIAIISAHTVPTDAHWLANLITPLKDEKTAMAYGRQVAMASSKFSEAEDFERTFGPTPRPEHPSRFAVNNANSALKKDLWEQYPFDDKLTGLEDIDWARHWMSKGFGVHYQPDAALYHIHEETWQQVRHRYYREAVAWRRMGLLKRRSIPTIVSRELLATLKDFSSAIKSNTNPVKERLSIGQRLREIAYFRSHKNYGTLKGLLSSHPMETREEQETLLFDRSTEAVVIHGPEKAALEMVNVPTLKPGDALIQVAHVAVCATDLEIFEGSLGYFKNGLASYPIVPGHEFSGHIAAVGQKVTALKEGDSVVAECIQSCGVCHECISGNFIDCEERTELGVFRRNGAYAGYVVVPSRFIHKLPAGTDMRRAALCEPLAVILKALRRIGPVLDGRQDALRCAVVGCGPLGHLCAKVLRHRGYAVTGFDRNPKRRELFDGTGINTSDNLEDLAKFNLIVEITGDPEVLDKALHLSPANATLLLLGLPYGQRSFSFENIAAFDKTVTGSVGSTAEDFIAAIELLAKLDLTPYFNCPMALADFESAWRKSQSGDVLKVILDPNQVAAE
ncbi:MAG: alcohol dehydrogenase catalytic domain-containing protein [Rhodospirillales bacterium]|nr:alcohol dehydrogenase catalytic domain-containing protein [Rhodospirillales bacterium]